MSLPTEAAKRETFLQVYGQRPELRGLTPQGHSLDLALISMNPNTGFAHFRQRENPGIFIDYIIGADNSVTRREKGYLGEINRRGRREYVRNILNWTQVTVEKGITAVDYRFAYNNYGREESPSDLYVNVASLEVPDATNLAVLGYGGFGVRNPCIGIGSIQEIADTNITRPYPGLPRAHIGFSAIFPTLANFPVYDIDLEDGSGSKIGEMELDQTFQFPNSRYTLHLTWDPETDSYQLERTLIAEGDFEGWVFTFPRRVDLKALAKLANGGWKDFVKVPRETGVKFNILQSS